MKLAIRVASIAIITTILSLQIYFIQRPISTIVEDNILKRDIMDELLTTFEDMDPERLQDAVMLVISELSRPSRVDRNLPKLYIITATYPRPEQLADLTRLAQTLMHVPNLIWLVVEDAIRQTPGVIDLLSRIPVESHHLLGPMPAKYRNMPGNFPRGVSNRNRALQWLRDNVRSGVFYFADDDNTYDIRLFEEIRTTRKVSVFPVGLLFRFSVSTPIINNGTIVGFVENDRKFGIDMAGFAVNIRFFNRRPNANMPYEEGGEEDGFLQSLSPLELVDLELKADNCTKVLVWHTQTKKNVIADIDENRYRGTNLIAIRKLLERDGLLSHQAALKHEYLVSVGQYLK